MKMNIERMKRTSSLFSALSLIITAVLLIALIAVFVVGIAALVNDGFMNLIVEYSEPFVKNDVYLIMAAAGICLPVITFMFFLAYKLFGNIGASHTPFSVENAKIMKLISYLMLILVAVSIAAETLIVLYSSWTTDTVQLGGGFILIVVAVLFYFMAHIFEYGAALQKESDETM